MRESKKIVFQVIILIATFIFALAMPTIFQKCSAQNSSTMGNNSFGVYTNASKPYGLTYGEWTARWWQWGYSIPKNINPAYDDTGVHCIQKQSGPVWFLAGTYGHTVVRHCDIPSGKAVLLPILNSECSFAEFPDLKTERDLRNCAKEMQDSVISVQATVDGVSIKDLGKYRIQSQLFNLTLDRNNILGLPAQTTTQAVSDGNWVFLKPLSVGKHVIYFKGDLKVINTTTNTTSTTSGPNSNYTFAGPYGWDFPVTYQLTITKP